MCFHSPLTRRVASGEAGIHWRVHHAWHAINAHFLLKLLSLSPAQSCKDSTFCVIRKDMHILTRGVGRSEDRPSFGGTVRRPCHNC